MPRNYFQRNIKRLRALLLRVKYAVRKNTFLCRNKRDSKRLWLIMTFKVFHRKKEKKKYIVPYLPQY